MLKKIFTILFSFSFLLIILLTFNLSYSVKYQDYVTSRTCSIAWSTSCDGGGNSGSSGAGINDAFNGGLFGSCDGKEYDPPGVYDRIAEVYINQTSVRTGKGIKGNCTFIEGNESGPYTEYEYVFYFNSTSWIRITNFTQSWSGSGSHVGQGAINRSFNFTVNNTEGTQVIRCSLRLKTTLTDTDFCAIDQTFGSDNDDVNFTVVDPLEYTTWNLTYSNGQPVPNGTTI